MFPQQRSCFATLPGEIRRPNLARMKELAISGSSARTAATDSRTNFARILVGVDGRAGGADALALTRDLASPLEAKVLAISVIPYGPFPVAFVPLDAGAPARDAAPLLEQAREALSGLQVETQAFGGGSPSWVMSDYAERGEVDLIVVGTPHHGRVGRVFLGSVATALLHGAACPVAVAPRGFAMQDHSLAIRLIAVAYDGTPESKIALLRAETLALQVGASLRLLTVVRPSRATAVPGAAGYVPAVPPEPERVLSAGMASVDPRLHVEGLRLDGQPAPTLAAACQDDVDLIVIGSRAYGPALRVILGSVSTELSCVAPCPVLVTARGD
jgi:nucleotide-binding universal stress UspA family protein